MVTSFKYLNADLLVCVHCIYRYTETHTASHRAYQRQHFPRAFCTRSHTHNGGIPIPCTVIVDGSLMESRSFYMKFQFILHFFPPFLPYFHFQCTQNAGDNLKNKKVIHSQRKEVKQNKNFSFAQLEFKRESEREKKKKRYWSIKCTITKLKQFHVVFLLFFRLLYKTVFFFGKLRTSLYQ